MSAEVEEPAHLEGVSDGVSDGLSAGLGNGALGEAFEVVGDEPAVADDDGEPAPSLATFAGRLDKAITTMHPPDRGPYTYAEISKGVKELGATLSTSYLWQLRRGDRDNPTLRQIEALARFFHLPVTWFVGGSAAEIESIEAQMNLVQVMRSPQVREVALRASSLTPAGLRAIVGILGQLEEVQGMTRRSRRSAGKNRPDGPVNGDQD